MLTIAVAFVIGITIGWTTPEPAWAKSIRVKLFGAASDAFKTIEDKSATPPAA